MRNADAGVNTNRMEAMPNVTVLLALPLTIGIMTGVAHAQLADAEPLLITWEETAVPLRAFHYDRRSFLCPPTDNPTAFPIWGDEFYKDDSSICAAAVHFGVITAAGGEVTIQEVDGLEDYPGLERNGVVSEPFGAWFFSFQFVGLFETVSP